MPWFTMPRFTMPRFSMSWFSMSWFSTPPASFRAVRAGGCVRRLERRIHDARWRPSRLTLAAAAASVVAIVTAVIVAGVSAGGASPAHPAGNPAAASPPTAAAGQDGPGQAGQTTQRASQAAGQHQASSSPPEQPARPVAAVPPSPAPAPSPAAPAPPPQPYLIYDSVTPDAIPPGHEIATYATGNEPTTAADVAGRGPVLWIDVTGTDYAASALDVEPGNVGPSQAATWAYGRLSSYPNQLAVIYTFQAEWPAVQAAVATLPAWMQSRIRWWIADPTGVPHMVPGAQATQWYWGPGYDISTAMPGF